MKLELLSDNATSEDFSNDSDDNSLVAAVTAVSGGGGGGGAGGLLLTPATCNLMSQLVPPLNFGYEGAWWQEDPDFFQRQQQQYSPTKMFIALEGLNSGVPTRTTPTLTPTTLRNIEQTFIELQTKPERHENEAGFVPPLVHSIGNNQYISASDASENHQSMYTDSTPPPDKSPSTIGWLNSTNTTSSSNSDSATPPMNYNSSNNSYEHVYHHGVGGATDTGPPHPLFPPPAQQIRRSMGGRKPTKDLNMSPEEEERRRVRRERNKAAAARCRKRRVDHTNALLLETDELEQKQQQLRDDLDQLQLIKQELKCLLETHCLSADCRLGTQSPPDIKPFVYSTTNDTNNNNNRVGSPPPPPPPPQRYTDPKVMLSSTTVPICRPSRPKFLNVITPSNYPHHNHQPHHHHHHPPDGTGSNMVGVAIQTPSSGMHFNFDSLMVGGTGLTPVTGPLVPSCSTQHQRHLVNTNNNNSSSSHNNNNNDDEVGDLVTPTSESGCGGGPPPKLVSL